MADVTSATTVFKSHGPYFHSSLTKTRICSRKNETEKDVQGGVVKILLNTMAEWLRRYSVMHCAIVGGPGGVVTSEAW